MPGLKKGKDVTANWKDFFDEETPKPPKGYLTAVEISKQIGIGLTYTRSKLKTKREKGEVDATQIRNGNGRTWYYKMKIKKKR